MLHVPHLREWRDRRLLTMRDLAEKSGVSLDTIIRLEHGTEARPTTIKKLAAALEVQPEQLFGQTASADQL